MNEEFSFSIQANNVIAAFYNKKAIVNVEGPDDVIFWSAYFNENDFEFKQADGCIGLKGIIHSIICDGLKQIVACDSDYDSFNGAIPNHPLIVKTMSHSIECMMYCPNNVNAFSQRMMRKLTDCVGVIEQVYRKFGDDVKDLVAYDIVNCTHGKGISVLGNSCKRFLQDNESCFVDRKKVDAFIDSIHTDFDQAEITSTLEKIDSDTREMRQIMKGHFQTDLVINLIRNLIKANVSKNAPIPKDNLYSSLVKCTPECKDQNVCKEKLYIMKEAS